MPWALAAAAVTAGAGILQSNAANKAAKSAQNAEQQAAQAQLAAQQQARDQVTQLQNPFIQAGYGALGQLGAQYGYGTPAAASGPPANGNVANPYAVQAPGPAQGPVETQGSRPAGPQTIPAVPDGSPAPGAYVGGVPVTTPGTPATPGGSPDWQGYIQQHPDVAQWIAEGHGDPNLGPNQTPEQAAQYQYENSFRIGNPEPPPPMLAESPGTPATTGQTPADAALSQAIGQRPTFDTPDYGAAPTSSSYFGKFQEDPGYQFARSEALRGVNANYGARGLLKSDAAIKAVMQRSTDLANQQYGNWWNRQNTLMSEDRNQFNNDRSANYNIYSNDRAFANNNFEDNRAFATNRYDNTSNNLFRVIGLGTGAAASVGGADSSYANAASNIYGAQGDNSANLALARGANNSQAIGSIAGAASNYLNLQSLSGSNYGFGSGSGGTPANWASALPTNPFATSYDFGGGF